MSFTRRLASASVILSLTLLVGRLAGLVREMQLGAVFGVSRDADFAVLMLTTPDILVNLLLAGGLSAALIPEFGRLDRGGRTRVFGKITLFVAILFGVVGLVIALFPKLLVLAFAPGYAGVQVAEYSQVFALAALAIPLAGLTGVTSALLNAEERFFIAGSGTLIFNVTIIATLFAWSLPGQELLVLGVAIVAAALLRYGSQLLACLPNLTLAPSETGPTDFNRLAKRFMQALGASTLVLLIPVILRALVSLGGEGNIAAYNFATKLVELPLGIAITTIAAVAFPALSKAIAAGDVEKERQLLEDGVQRSLCLAVCIAVPCIWFAPALVELVFGRGRMDAESLNLIADMARLGFLTLPAVAISSMTTALLNSRGQTGLLLTLTIAVTVLVPVVALPGIVLGDVFLILAALPAFHLAYAAILVRGARQPLFVSWNWMWKSLLRPLLAALLATVLSAAIWMALGGGSAVIGSGFAMAAIVISLVAAGVVPLRRRVV